MQIQHLKDKPDIHFLLTRDIVTAISYICQTDMIAVILSHLTVSHDGFNPFMPNGLFYRESLDRPISNRRSVWLIFFIITMFYRNSFIWCKQCRPRSDTAFCKLYPNRNLIWNHGTVAGERLLNSQHYSYREINRGVLLDAFICFRSRGDGHQTDRICGLVGPLLASRVSVNGHKEETHLQILQQFFFTKEIYL